MKPKRIAMMLAAVSFVGFPALAIQNTPATTPPPAATATTAPTTAPAGAVVLNATITSAKGVVQVRQSEDQPWQPATVGMKMGQGAEVRTGLRSAVQFTIEPDQIITLDRLGTLKVLQAYLEPGKVTTDLGVKYGRTRYDIQSIDLQHQSTIRSPGSTLAIRGTDVTYEDQVPWVPTAVSRTGRAQFRNFRRESIAFGGTKPAAVTADKSSAAQNAQANTRLDPRGAFSGRTGAENDLLLELPATAGTDAQGLAAVRALGQVGGFKGTFVGVPSVPGPLFFQLDWFSVSQSSRGSNLDLRVADPKGGIASATNPVIGTGSAQGVHQGDNLGKSGSGAESVAWGLFFPPGKYKVEAINRGNDTAAVFISVTQGDAQIKTFGVEPSPSIVLKPGERFAGEVTTQAPVVSPQPAARAAKASAEAQTGRRARPVAPIAVTKKR